MQTRVIILMFFVFSLSFSQTASVSDTTSSIVNIAVLDLEPRGGLTATEILSVSDRLRGELINTGKYTVLERSQMDEILKEQGFQRTGVCSEASCIVEVGQLLAVHKMVGGSIGKVGKAYSINLKIIDVETGKIERLVSDDVKCTKEELVSFHIRNVARKMAGLVKLKRPWYTKWYLWTPVVLAGAGAGTYFALYGKDNASPSGGDTQSGRPVDIEVEVQ